jgi:hypothetical protein
MSNDQAPCRRDRGGKAAHIPTLAIREKHQHRKLLAHSCISQRRAAEERACVFWVPGWRNIPREGAHRASALLPERKRGLARAPLALFVCQPGTMGGGCFGQEKAPPKRG